jgi:hypothetical protein
MQEGLSTSRRCDASAACLAAAGRRFVFRYHSRPTSLPEKRLTPAEAATLARAGLSIATVYQDRAREPADFGAARGEQDGLSAFIHAGQVGQPPGSAIYFAVDTDFSQAQLRSLVMPYFRGVKAAFDRAAPNGPVFRIGVYGSGLACRLLKSELGFVELTWLAEATGWRESKTYTGWDVKQQVNGGQMLCSLGPAWEHCEAHESFGQFQPVGFALAKGQGTPMMVTATALNLRVAPTTQGNDPVATLPQGKIVNVLGTSAPGWLRVRCELDGGDVIGHVSAKHLAAPTADAHDIAALEMPAVPPVHLRENNVASKRAATAGRAFPLGEPQRPGRRPGVDVPARCEDLRLIGDWLAVPASARYRRDTVTYCNVYAADCCYLADVYLPRVWWTDKALAAIFKGTVPAVAYGQTVREMRADDLHQWLIEYGPQFGWRRVFDTSALQAAANGGGIGLICADRDAAGKPGHITVVVPEDGTHQAQRDADGNVTQPLQTQAGAQNFRYGSAGANWWRSQQFRSFVFFAHD